MEVQIRLKLPDIVGARKFVGVPVLWRLCRNHSIRREDASWAMLVQRLRPAELRKADAVRRRFVAFAIKSMKELCGAFCEFVDVGTKLPSSDIDITIRHAKTSHLIEVVDDTAVPTRNENQAKTLVDKRHFVCSMQCMVERREQLH
jgi:hypothetical protein